MSILLKNFILNLHDKIEVRCSTVFSKDIVLKIQDHLKENQENKEIIIFDNPIFEEKNFQDYWNNLEDYYKTIEMQNGRKTF